MEPEVCEVLYRFFRTASDFLQGYRSDAPYPQSFTCFTLVKTDPQTSSDADQLHTGIPRTQNKITIPSHTTRYDQYSSGEYGAYGEQNNYTDYRGKNRSQGEKTEPFTSMQEVYAAIAQCSSCVLSHTRTKPAAGEGPEELSCLTNSVEVMVVGEGPGADEDKQGRPFVGRAGMLLDKMLEAIQLSRKTNCYITNVVKCRPPRNRDPAPEERSCCAAFLNAQIHLIRPKMILVMGRVAAQHLLQTTDGIGKLHGHFFAYEGIPLMPTYHPSALLRDESLKRPAWEDLKRFRARLLELQRQVS